MKPHILIAMDLLTDEHVDRIATATGDWAVVERIPEATPPAEYLARLEAAEIVAGWPEPQWLLDSPVRLFQCGSAGPDKYLGARLEHKDNFTLCSARDVMSIPVAEHAVALMLALVRRLPHHLRDGHHRRFARLPIQQYDELTGATACVVGLGGIGTEVARRCLGLDMRVVGVRRDAREPHPLVSQVYGTADLQRAVVGADHVVLTVPGGPASKHLVDATVIDAMKSGARLYNLSRGSVVDEHALLAGLRDGHLAGAGLDVFAQEPLPADSPLWEMEQVLITPHCGGLSVRVADRMCELLTVNLNNYRLGRPLLNAVGLAPERAPR